MDIQKHIRELLAQQDCVIVPGLGGFITQYKPAAEDMHGKKIYPPSRSISFNRMLNQNDGILIQHIASKGSITYKAAEEKVYFYVDACNRQLSVRGIVILPEIGKLYNDANGNLNFSPVTGRNYLPATYGLQAVSWFTTYAQLIAEPATAVQETVEIVEEEQVQLPQPEVIKPARRQRRYVKSLIASGISVAALVILTVQGVYVKPLQISSLGIINTHLTLPEITKPERHTTTTPTLKAGNHPAPVMMPETDVVRTHDAVIEEGYYVVLGSFNNKEKADRYVKQQKLENELLVLDNGTAQFRVATYVTTSTSQALSSLEHFRHNFRSDVWLLYNSY